MLGACICYDCLQVCSLQNGFQWLQNRFQWFQNHPRDKILVNNVWSDSNDNKQENVDIV